MVMIRAEDVEGWLATLYIGVEDAGLRREDLRKAAEVAAMLVEVERAIARLSSRSTVSLVDAAAGKSYLGLLAAVLVLEPLGRKGEIITIERDSHRVARSRKAVPLLHTSISVQCRAGDVSVPQVWPERPSIVAALHACGRAADDIIDQAIAHDAKILLLAPCCTGKSVAAAGRAVRAASSLGIPRQAPVRRRFIQAWVDAERTWRLESAGYETEVVEFVAPTITPHNLLWRARRVRGRARMSAATAALERMLRAQVIT